MAARAVYEPSPWGARFHALTCHEALGGGAAGGGKSVCLRADPLEQIITEHNRCLLPEDHPHHLDWGRSKGRALYLRRVSTMLDETERELHHLLNAVVPGGAKWSEVDKTWTLKSGYVYRIGHCKDRGDWNRYWGDELTWLGFDEVTQFLQNQVDKISLRVRTSDPVLIHMCKVRMMANPVIDMDGMDGVSMDEDVNWVRKRFVDPWPQGEKLLVTQIKMEDGSLRKWTRTFLPARLRDNPNKEFAQEYEFRLRKEKPHIRRALLEGDWYVTAGSYFGEAWDGTQIIKRFEIPDTWPIFRSMDWGFKRPGCVHWWTVDPDDNLIGLREMTFKGKDAAKVAEEIIEIEKKEGWMDEHAKRSPFMGPADTQLWEKRGDVGLSKAEEMAAKGVFWHQADKKSRDRNAERMYMRMQDKRGGIPSFALFQGMCPSLEKTIPAVLSKPAPEEGPMDGGDDHWLDSAFYACAFASHGRRGLPRRKPSILEDDEDDDEPVRKKRKPRNRLGY